MARFLIQVIYEKPKVTVEQVLVEVFLPRRLPFQVPLLSIALGGFLARQKVRNIFVCNKQVLVDRPKDSSFHTFIDEHGNLEYYSFVEPTEVTTCKFFVVNLVGK